MTLKEYCIQEGVQRCASASNGTVTLYGSNNQIVGFLRVPNPVSSDEDALKAFSELINWNCRANGQNISVSQPTRGVSVLDLLEEAVEEKGKKVKA